MFGPRLGVALGLVVVGLSGCAGTQRRWAYTPTQAEGVLPPAEGRPIDPFVAEHNGGTNRDRSRIARFFPSLPRRASHAHAATASAAQPAPADDAFVAGARAAVIAQREKSASAAEAPLASVPARRASARRKPGSPAPMLPVAVQVRAFPEEHLASRGPAPAQPEPPIAPTAALPQPAPPEPSSDELFLIVPRDGETHLVQAEIPEPAPAEPPAPEPPEESTPPAASPPADPIIESCDPPAEKADLRIPDEPPPATEPTDPAEAPTEPVSTDAEVDGHGPEVLLPEETQSPASDEASRPPEEPTAEVADGPAPIVEPVEASPEEAGAPSPDEPATPDPDTGGDPALEGRPRLPATRSAHVPSQLPPPEYPRAYYPDRTPPSERATVSAKPPRVSIARRLVRRLRGLGRSGNAEQSTAAQ
jgi:hypothetical protein